MAFVDGEKATTVSSHLALTLLLTITFSTTAQAFHILASDPYRVFFYLHIFPFFTFSEALYFPLRITVYSLAFRLPIAKTIKLVARADHDAASADAKSSTHDTKIEPWNSQPLCEHPRSWPRYVLFILCPLPACLKLLSCTGIPGTKTLGIISFATFIATELFLIFPGPSRMLPSVPEILGYSAIEWEMEAQHELRSRIDNLNEKLSKAEGYARRVVFLLHGLLILYATMGLWRYFTAFVKIDTNMSRAYGQLIHMGEIIVYLGGMLLFITWVSSLLGYGHIPHVLEGVEAFIQLLKYTSVVLFYLYNLPRKTDPVEGPVSTFMNSLSGIAFAWPAFWLLRRVADWAVRRHPGLGKALMITKEVLDAEKDEGFTEIIDLNWDVFCLFLIDLSVGVLWYLVLYDERGTVSPRWMQILGR